MIIRTLSRSVQRFHGHSSLKNKTLQQSRRTYSIVSSTINKKPLLSPSANQKMSFHLANCVSQSALKTVCFNQSTTSRKTIRLLSTTDSFGMDYEISCSELQEDMENNGDLYVIDVRQANEIEIDGTISGSLLIPLGELEGALRMTEEGFQNKYGVTKPLDDGEQLVFHCHAGIRSLKATMIARSLGYEGARNLIGGIVAWNHLQESSKL